MKCQIQFCRKNKKNISECHQLKFLPSMQNVNTVEYLGFMKVLFCVHFVGHTCLHLLVIFV